MKVFWIWSVGERISSVLNYSFHGTSEWCFFFCFCHFSIIFSIVSLYVCCSITRYQDLNSPLSIDAWSSQRLMRNNVLITREKLSNQSYCRKFLGNFISWFGKSDTRILHFWVIVLKLRHFSRLYGRDQRFIVKKRVEKKREKFESFSERDWQTWTNFRILCENTFVTAGYERTFSEILMKRGWW